MAEFWRGREAAKAITAAAHNFGRPKIMRRRETACAYDEAGLGFTVSRTANTLRQNSSLDLLPAPAVYTYVKNLQGDVIRILDSKGNAVVDYTYDPWGVPTVIGDAEIAELNPCTYRGYYYDQETGYYYLQSRYYDPKIGRFLNADEADALETQTDVPLEYNMFAYCCNRPVLRDDPTGLGSVYLVGFGIQIEFSLGPITDGLEIVWYHSSRVNVGGRNRYIPYIYVYIGGSIGPGADSKSAVKKLIANPKLLLNPKEIFSGGLSGSVCVFAIFGYRTFNSPNSYLKWFSGVSVTVAHIKGYTSWSSTCFTVGAGWHSKYAAASGSATYYVFANISFSNIRALYVVAYGKAKTLKP